MNECPCLIPSIKKVREMTMDNDERITQTWEEKYIKSIANGIWQEARAGHYNYTYLVSLDNVSFKINALARAEEAYRKEGYIVFRLSGNSTINATVQISWSPATEGEDKNDF